MTFHVSIQKKYSNNLVKAFLEHMPYFRGCWLVYAPVLGLFSVDQRMVHVSITQNGTHLFTRVYDVSDPAQLYMAMNNRYDLGTAMTIWSLLNQGDTFLDVGANFGYFTDIASGKVGEAGKVIAIEPNPRAFKTLAKLEQKNIEKINKIAGKNSHDRYHMHQPFYRQTTGSQFNLNPNGSMESTNLDDVYESQNQKHVTLIKIDTEGAELFVLQGAQKLLEEQKPFVIAEVFGHAEDFDYKSLDIYEFMQGLGYHYFYMIDDAAVSVSRLEKPAEGQILFATQPYEAFDTTR